MRIGIGKRPVPKQPFAIRTLGGVGGPPRKGMSYPVGPVISTIDSPPSRSLSADGRVERRIARTLWLDVLPQVSQITLGGGPCCWRR